MIRSFTDTCTQRVSGVAVREILHTTPLAVRGRRQDDRPRCTDPASAGIIHALKTCRKKTQEMSAIENGFTSQFTNRVTNSPRGFLPTSRIAPKSTLIIIGMIMSQMRIAIGTLT